MYVIDCFTKRRLMRVEGGNYESEVLATYVMSVFPAVLLIEQRCIYKNSVNQYQHMRRLVMDEHGMAYDPGNFEISIV